VTLTEKDDHNAEAPAPAQGPAWVEIDLDAIAHNYHVIRRGVGPDTRVCPVVKSNAYGHGLLPVSRRLLREGAYGLCVARLWEAGQLRSGGIDAPVLCLTSVFPSEARRAVELGLEVVVYRPEPARALSQAAQALGRPVRVHLKVDCGMGRLGVWPNDAVDFARMLRGLKGLELHGLMSHFSNADDPDERVSIQQMKVYAGVQSRLAEAGLLPPVCHHCNSDATMRFESARHQLVRPGVSTYGCYPSDWYRERHDLRPAMSVRARLISVRRVPAGTGLSYSHEFTTSRDSLIGVVSVGYADGYLRALKGKASMLVRGRRVPVVGRICMEQSLLDLTDVSSPDSSSPPSEPSHPLERVSEGPPSYGDVVTVLGADGAERITAEELGAWAGTINYEIVCGLGRQYPRVYFGAE